MYIIISQKYLLIKTFFLLMTYRSKHSIAEKMLLLSIFKYNIYVFKAHTTYIYYIVLLVSNVISNYKSLKCLHLNYKKYVMSKYLYGHYDSPIVS